MCGFFAANFRIEPEKLGEIAARLQSRGPDDIVARGFDGGSYVFARLSILDPMSSSMQPGNYNHIESSPVILFNGEVYNFKTLGRAEGLCAPVSHTQVLERLLLWRRRKRKTMPPPRRAMPTFRGGAARPSASR